MPSRAIWRTEKVVYERLAPRDFDRVEPALNRSLRVAYFLPDRAQVRNPRHLRALALAQINAEHLARGLEASGAGHWGNDSA